MDKVVVVDTETTIFQKGNPFSARNRLCYVGAYPEGGSLHVGSPAILPYLEREVISQATVVAFNWKFDLHHLRRAGCNLSNRRIWDAQLAHFMLSGQRERYPSLDGVLAHYGLPPKDPHIEEYYWSKGIDTPDIPQDEILSYLCTDLERTMAVYKKQREEFEQKPKLLRLFRLACQDLHVLAEMEWNGLLLDVEKAATRSKEIVEQVSGIETYLNSIYPHISINWNSGDDISSVLYGGTITREFREIAGLYKTGAKTGQPRYKIRVEEYSMPQLVTPLEGSELKKPGYFSTDESVLKQLKGQKLLIAALLSRASLTKELDYYVGLPKLLEEKDWGDSTLHGQLNQCVAATGRLSASAPNQQNLSEGIKECIVSRYAS